MGAEQRRDRPGVVPPVDGTGAATVGRYLAARATAVDAPALYAGDTRWSWAQVAAWSDATGGRLRAAGAVPGDRVAYVVDPAPSVATCIAFLAAVSAGLAVVPVNARFSRSERDAVLAAARPAHVFDDAALHAAVSASTPGPDDRDAPLRGDGDAPLRDGDAPLRGDAPAPAVADAVAAAVDDDLVIVCSSGTTGAAKGIRCTHGNAVASAVAVNRALALTAHDRWLLCLPMVHVGALSVLWRALVSGCAVVVSDPAEPDLVTAAPTVASLVPTQLHRLVRDGAAVPSGLRCVLLGGGPVGDGPYADAVAAGWPVRPSYGLSEMCSTVAVVPPPRTGATTVPSALPLDGVACTVVDGHVLVDGPMRSPGRAWGPPADEVVVDDRTWIDTHDLGTVDADGRLRILGRADAMFVVGGENVHPEEVETVLLRDPGVAGALVRGVPDDDKGTVAVATVVATDPTSPPDTDALRAHCRRHLAAYKVPVRIDVVDDLPRTATGKVRRL